MARESAAGTVSDRTYEYDKIGNILSVEEKPAVGDAEKQCFRTDPLGRLSTAWTPKTTVACGVDPTAADLGGPAPYWQDWTFDVTGSRLTETSHATAGDTLRKYAVPTGGKNVAGPHTLSTMTTTAPGKAAETTEYRYDQAGNMICRPVADATTNDCDSNANNQSLGWNSEGELSSVTAGGTSVDQHLRRRR